MSSNMNLPFFDTLHNDQDLDYINNVEYDNPTEKPYI